MKRLLHSCSVDGNIVVNVKNLQRISTARKVSDL
jgi:hypothetical protein